MSEPSPSSEEPVLYRRPELPSVLIRRGRWGFRLVGLLAVLATVLAAAGAALIVMSAWDLAGSVVLGFGLGALAVTWLVRALLPRMPKSGSDPVTTAVLSELGDDHPEVPGTAGVEWENEVKRDEMPDLYSADTVPINIEAQWEAERFDTRPARRLDGAEGQPAPGALLDLGTRMPTLHNRPGQGARESSSVLSTWWLRDVSADRPTVELTKDRFVIGNGPDADLVLGGGRPGLEVMLTRDQNGWRTLAHPGQAPRVVRRGAPAVQLGAYLEDLDLLEFGTGTVLEVLRRRINTHAGDLNWTAGAKTSAGGRDENEDSAGYFATSIVVADGVGGVPGGARASKLAVTSVHSHAVADPHYTLMPLMDRLAVDFQSSAAGSIYSAKATTLDVIHLVERASGWRVEGAHVGDGFVFLYENGLWMQMTVPHTVRELNRSLGLAPEAENIALNELTQVVSAGRTIEPQYWSIDAAPGQRWIVCTDGITNSLGISRLREQVKGTRGLSAGETAQAVIDAALTGEDLDNLTIIIADVVEAVERRLQSDPGRRDPALGIRDRQAQDRRQIDRPQS